SLHDASPCAVRLIPQTTAIRTLCYSAVGAAVVSRQSMWVDRSSVGRGRSQEPQMSTRKRNYHGVAIGVLMLETHFERFNGDIGNARTWPFPVQSRIVPSATPDRVTSPSGPRMLDEFKAAADELIAGGVDGITTTCGFLALYQNELAA